MQNHAKRCLPFWICRCLEEIQWNIITWKKKFYRHLSIEDITNANYAHAKRVWKGSKINNVGDYHDLYVKRDKLLVADVFENFWNMYLKIYELFPAHFLSVPGLTW